MKYISILLISCAALMEGCAYHSYGSGATVTHVNAAQPYGYGYPAQSAYYGPNVSPNGPVYIGTPSVTVPIPVPMPVPVYGGASYQRSYRYDGGANRYGRYDRNCRR